MTAKRGSAPSEAYYRSLGYQAIKVRLAPGLIEKLDAEAERRGVNRTQLLGELIKKYCKGPKL